MPTQFFPSRTRTNKRHKLRPTWLLSALFATALFVATMGTTLAANASAGFEGTLQQVTVSLGPGAVRSLAGSADLETVLALSPDAVLAAVKAGKIKAQSIERATVEIRGNKARLQPEGKAVYTLLDADKHVASTVMPANRMIVVTDAATLKKAAKAGGQTGSDSTQTARKIGEQTIRDYDTTGYRFTFFGDNVAIVWLSQELTDTIGPVLASWLSTNPMLGTLAIPDGTPIRVVTVNSQFLAGKSELFPAYTLTEFYDLKSQAIAADRFVMPDGYKRTTMAEMMSSGAG